MKLFLLFLPIFTWSQIINNNAYDLSLLNTNNEKYTIMEFWASWCLPCIESFEKIENFEDKYEKDIEYILINPYDDVDKIKEITSKYNFKANIISDNDKYFQDLFEVDMMGTFFIFNKDKSMVWTGYSGILKEEYINDLVLNHQIKAIPQAKKLIEVSNYDFELLVQMGDLHKARELGLSDNKIILKNFTLEGIIQYLGNESQLFKDNSCFKLYFDIQINNHGKFDENKEKILQYIIKSFNVKQENEYYIFDLDYLLDDVPF